MRRTRVLTGGIVALILLAVVCIPRHLASPLRAAYVTPATFHASVEAGNLVLRGSLPSERSKAAILEQAHALSSKTRMRVSDLFVVDEQVDAAAWVEKVPQFLPILGLMANRGSIIIDGRSLVVSGQVNGHREKADVLQAMAPAIRAGLRIEDRVRVVSTTSASSAVAPLSALQLSLNQILAKSPIEFESNGATITAKGRGVLDQIIALLRRDPNTPIEITGRTNSIGETEHNLQLSRRRAESVKQYLTSHGLANSFTATGAGSARPLSPGRHQPDFPQNERIELLM